MFIEDLRNELNSITQVTENGAVGYATSGKNLLDINFRVSSYRNMTESEILRDFLNAFNEDKILAMRWLFYARDAREGLGERRTFKTILKGLSICEPELVRSILPLIAEYGRWDDLFVLADTNMFNDVMLVIANQMNKDIEDYNNGESVSLLAKWMPSINCSNKERKALAKKIVKTFNLSERTYRQVLSLLRTRLDVVEKKMSAGQWDKINYSFVASRANLNYNKAFFKHDAERREAFINSVTKGEAKINGSTNFPHDVLAKYLRSNQVDNAIEALWKALPNYGNLENTIVVADGSGSMCSGVGSTGIRALDVANSLAIYFAEHCEGAFKNKYITFSERPQLVDLGNGTLLSKKKIAENHNEVANTNIEAVFDLILKTAVRNSLPQEEIPNTILIISDMEFDSCTRFYDYENSRYSRPLSRTLFEELAKRFADAGYKMPKLAFWNVMSRSLTIPVQGNEMGVSLVSGFGPAAIKMVLSGKTDPYEALVETLKNKRYDAVEEAIIIQ